MKRRTFDLLTALSAALCVASAVLWLRSWGHHSVTLWSQPGYMLEARQTDGVFGFIAARDSLLHVSVPGGRLYGLSHHRRLVDPGGHRTTFTHNDWGFGWHWLKTVGPPPSGQWRVGGKRICIAYVPGWLPAALLAAPPAAWLALRARSNRRRAGLCRECGYDLRATPGRCPECGDTAPVPRPAGSALD